MVKNDLKELEGFPGFFVIPGAEIYGVNVSGDVVNSNTGVILAGSYNPDGYKNYRLTLRPGYALTMGLHRILGIVFKHPGKDISKLTVNHIDGDKGNNDLDNLEWTTYRGNQEHAGLNKLTTKCTPILVRDVFTGEVEFFPSMKECARKYDMTKDAINWRIKKSPYTVFPEGKQYKSYHDKREWLETLSSTGAGTIYARKSIMVLRFHNTKEVLTFGGMVDLAKFLGVSPSTITAWMKLPKETVLPGLVEIRQLGDATPWNDSEDALRVYEETFKRKVVVRFDTITSSEFTFGSVKECADALSLTPNALNYHLKKTTPDLIYGRYKVWYKFGPLTQ